jgi:uncharacterized protein with HEPN domain
MVLSQTALPAPSKLIHDCIGVDLEEVWNVASARIPELLAVLERFLRGEGSGSPPVA